MTGTPTPTQSTNAKASLAYQLNREARWAVYLTLIYVAGWVIFAYFMPNNTGMLGFPLWFELSCVFLPLIFILVSVAVLKAVYKEVDLDADLTTDNREDA